MQSIFDRSVLLFRAPLSHAHHACALLRRRHPYHISCTYAPITQYHDVVAWEYTPRRHLRWYLRWCRRRAAAKAPHRRAWRQKYRMSISAFAAVLLLFLHSGPAISKSFTPHKSNHRRHHHHGEEDQARGQGPVPAISVGQQRRRSCDGRRPRSAVRFRPPPGFTRSICRTLLRHLPGQFGRGRDDAVGRDQCRSAPKGGNQDHCYYRGSLCSYVRR